MAPTVCRLWDRPFTTPARSGVPVPPGGQESRQRVGQALDIVAFPVMAWLCAITVG